MNCPSCGHELQIGEIRPWRSYWIDYFSKRSSIPAVFVGTSGKRATIVRSWRRRLAYACNRCRTVIVPPAR